VTIGEKILQAIIDGGMVRVSCAIGKAHRTDQDEDEICNPRVVFTWSANVVEQIDALVNAETDYPCLGGCGLRINKKKCDGCFYAAMTKSREEDNW
jgi:hypothetical protein